MVQFVGHALNKAMFDVSLFEKSEMKKSWLDVQRIHGRAI